MLAIVLVIVFDSIPMIAQCRVQLLYFIKLRENQAFILLLMLTTSAGDRKCSFIENDSFFPNGFNRRLFVIMLDGLDFVQQHNGGGGGGRIGV